MKSLDWRNLLGVGTAFALTATMAFAQEEEGAAAEEEARPSPAATVKQVVGVTPITIEYSSPGVKGRTIWGDLVPYGENWRAGANEKTTWTFEEDVEIGGEALEAGTYGFYIVPKEEGAWELVWNTNAAGSPMQWDASQDAIRVEVTPEDAPMRERLAYGFDNFTDEKPYTAIAYLHWEEKKLPVEIEMKGAGGPTISMEAAPIFEIVSQVMAAVKEQDIEKMVSFYADDFTSDQGGGKPEMQEFLQGAKEQGFLEDIQVIMDDIEIEVDGDKATVDNVELEGAFGVLTLGFELEKRDDKWLVTYQSQY